MSAPTSPPPPLPVRRRSRAWIWIPVTGVLVLIGILALAGWGLALVADQVGDDIRDNPVIVEHIGTLEDVRIDWWGSANAPGAEDFVFHLVGSKGEGTLHATVVTVDGDRERVTRGRLELPSGARHELFPAERER